MADYYGVLAQFETPEALRVAARRLRGDGFAQLEAFAPHFVDGLARDTGAPPSRLGPLTLVGGIAGGTLGFSLQYWVSVYAYPLNVGGRPLNSWPSFLPVTFETTVLGAALTAALAMFFRNGLPRLHHPLFSIPAFASASSSGFFLCVRTSNRPAELDRARQRLADLDPVLVVDVPN